MSRGTIDIDDSFVYSSRMRIEDIRRKVDSGDFSIGDHALTESFRDGLTTSDVVHCLLHGEIIEEYPDRRRCLVYGRTTNRIPVHVVVDYAWKEEIDIVTVYIPNAHVWINYRIRRKPKGRNP